MQARSHLPAASVPTIAVPIEIVTYLISTVSQAVPSARPSRTDRRLLARDLADICRPKDGHVSSYAAGDRSSAVQTNSLLKSRWRARGSDGRRQLGTGMVRRIGAPGGSATNASERRFVYPHVPALLRDDSRRFRSLRSKRSRVHAPVHGHPAPGPLRDSCPCLHPRPPRTRGTVLLWGHARRQGVKPRNCV